MITISKLDSNGESQVRGWGMGWEGEGEESKSLDLGLLPLCRLMFLEQLGMVEF